MPIYEYSCAKCGTFEATQRITEKPLRRCPTCKGKVSKLISSTSFQLKGSGWYVTDYGGKDGKKDGGEKKSDSASPSSEGKSSEGKSSEDKSSDAKASDAKGGTAKGSAAKGEATAA